MKPKIFTSETESNDGDPTEVHQIVFVQPIKKIADNSASLWDSLTRRHVIYGLSTRRPIFGKTKNVIKSKNYFELYQ